MEAKLPPQSHIRQLVHWCDELSELQALEGFLAIALGDAQDSHCQNASLLASQLQCRLQQLRAQMQSALLQLRADGKTFD
ncbi:MAG: hypothetical protein OIF34_03820 [Porticoccaceae bacterium]|nr:hypothetical protein [Porticoccaceae bacterium]